MTVLAPLVFAAALAASLAILLPWAARVPSDMRRLRDLSDAVREADAEMRRLIALRNSERDQ